jgi:hypothetical protein
MNDKSRIKNGRNSFMTKGELEKWGDNMEYPRTPGGKIALREGLNNKLKKEMPDIPAEQIGGLDWTLKNMFGSLGEGIRTIEALVVGQGSKADPRWPAFLLAYRRKCEDALDKGEQEPSMNSVAALLDISVPEFLGSITKAIQQLSLNLSQIKVAQNLPTIVDASIEAAKDLEKGGKDREMLMKVGGLINEQKGVNVSVNQQVGVSIKKEDLAAPLRQFSKEIKDLDEIAREEIVEGEVVDE